MVFSLSGKVHNRIVNSHGELMDVVTIWVLRGKIWRAFLQYRLSTTEKCDFDGVGAAPYHQVLARKRSQASGNRDGTFQCIWPGCGRAAEHKIVAPPNQAVETQSSNANVVGGPPLDDVDAQIL
jgi:hypothetical protein